MRQIKQSPCPLELAASDPRSRLALGALLGFDAVMTTKAMSVIEGLLAGTARFRPTIES
jgi:hypothetical protein